jgi:uncharacterized membrane protein YeaQ/YmgE (transglycosylase-associated protein family)
MELRAMSFSLRNPWVVFLLVIGIGLLIGWLVERVSKNGGGLLTSGLVGIAGSFIGFHLASLLHWRGHTPSLIAAGIGAAVIVFASEQVKGAGHSHRHT